MRDRVEECLTFVSVFHSYCWHHLITTFITLFYGMNKAIILYFSLFLCFSFTIFTHSLSSVKSLQFMDSTTHSNTLCFSSFNLKLFAIMSRISTHCLPLPALSVSQN